jgi:ribosome maturation factor RimP
MAQSATQKLELLLAPHVRALGYDLLDLDYAPRSAHGGAMLRLFIENPSGAPILFEDCAKVDRGLDSVIEGEEFGAFLSDSFTLEVSSPGLDRPLKLPSDFQKFAGQAAQVKTFRPLTKEEMGNEKYFEHHQKQKNFVGVIRGFNGDAVEMETDKLTYRVPFALITKANLDVSSKLIVDEK